MCYMCEREKESDAAVLKKLPKRDRDYLRPCWIGFYDK